MVSQWRKVLNMGIVNINGQSVEKVLNMGIVNISGQSVEKGSQYGDGKYKWSVSGERFSIWG